VERLFAEQRGVTLYFSNSNINSREEYEKRWNEVRKFADHFQLSRLADPYDHEAWLAHVSKVPGFASLPERGLRCHACFQWSLDRTAAKAKELGMNFSTTLTVSPHKDSRLIFAIAEKHPHFEPYNFKKQDGFKRSLELSRELNLYRQNYCGCEFSLRSFIR